MSPQDITRFRVELIRLADELRTEGDVALDPGRKDATQVGVDDDEQPIAEMTQAIASGRNRARTNQLRAIERALRRLDTEPNDFGTCVDCQEEIAPKRLEAMPWVELCLECQAREENETAKPYGRRRIDDYR